MNALTAASFGFFASAAMHVVGLLRVVSSICKVHTYVVQHCGAVYGEVWSTVAVVKVAPARLVR